MYACEDVVQNNGLNFKPSHSLLINYKVIILECPASKVINSKLKLYITTIYFYMIYNFLNFPFD